MTASRFSRSRVSSALTAALVVGTSIAACAAPRRDASAPLATVSGELLADGSCRVTVNGAALFTPADRPRASYDAGPVADIAPAGYALHQLTCASADSDSTRSSDTHATDERMVMVTLYGREGAPLRIGRYTIREALETASDTTDVAARAGLAIFGAPVGSRDTSGAADEHHAGVRYLEARGGTLSITSVTRGADGDRVVGTFTARASPAWSM